MTPTVVLRMRAFAGALLAVSGAGSAQNAPDAPGFYTPPADDTAVGMLREIFGSVVDTITSGQRLSPMAPDSAIAAGFQVFGLGVLGLAMLFVIFTTIKAAIDTSHDGEFLGRELSDVWVPLRTVGGTALLLPTVSGFSLIQVAVLWISIMGVGLADRVVDAMADAMAANGMLGHPNIPDARPLAATILRFEVCAQAMNREYARQERALRVEPQSQSRTVVNSGEILRVRNAVNVGAVGQGALVGTAGLVGAAENVVGAFVKVTDYSWSAIGADGFVNNEGVCGKLSWQESPESSESNSNVNVSKGPIMAAQSAAVRRMIDTLRPVAVQIANGEKPTAGAIETAATEYADAIRHAAAGAVATANAGRSTAFLTYVKEGGFLFVGTYYNQVISQNDAVQSAVNAVPTSSAATIDLAETAWALQDYRDKLAFTDEYLKNRAGSARAAYDAADIDWSDIRSWEDAKRWLSQPALVAISEMTQEIAGSNTSHVAQMKAVGDTVMATGWTMLGAMSVAKGAAGSRLADWTVGNVFNLEKFLDPIQGLVGTMTMLLLGAGAFLAFYAPMVPYVNWVVGIIKWVVMVIESVVAAPIWGAAHVHPDGDQHVGRAGPGYMIILGLFLRPTLMVLGFAFAIVVAQPIAHFVNLTYITQVQGAMGDSANGLGAFLAFTVIYAVIMTIVLHSVFSLIHYIPDQALRWIGHAIGAQGVADSETSQTQHVVVGAMTGGAQGAFGHRRPGQPQPPSRPGAGGRPGAAAPTSALTRPEDHSG